MNALRVVRAARVANFSSASRRILNSNYSRLTLNNATPRFATALPSYSRTFAVSAKLREAKGENALSAKLQSEIDYEANAATENPEVPEFLQTSQKAGVWAIEEKVGHDEVVLTRKFGNENIRVMFSIVDVENETPEFEEEENGSGSEDEGAGSIFPVRCSVTITKPNGAMSIEAVAQDGVFSIENISFYKDAALATDLTPEADWKRRSLYIGPQFEHLDVSVQEELEKYLLERGIGEELALFVPEYAEWKEQKEYVGWLKNVKQFVDA